METWPMYTDRVLFLSLNTLPKAYLARICAGEAEFRGGRWLIWDLVKVCVADAYTIWVRESFVHGSMDLYKTP